MMSTRRIAAITVGIIGLLVGAALVSGATTMLTEDRDADGFYVSDEYPFTQASHAIVSGDIEMLTDAPAWLMDWITDPVALRLQGSSSGDHLLFLGLGPTPAVEDYLADVAHHEVTDLSFDNSVLVDVTYAAHGGEAAPGAPSVETFWAVSTQGPAEQTLDWDVESGSWTAVVMNADGSAGIDVDLGIGTRIENIIAISWVALGIGIAAVLGFGSVTYRGFRAPVDPQPPRVIDLRKRGAGTRPKEPVA